MLEKIPSYDSSLMQEAAAPSATDPLDYWRLCDRLSVVQAAMLIVGEDPGVPHHTRGEDPQGYCAAQVAVERAIRAEDLPAEDDGINAGYHAYYTTVAVDDLRNWLRSRGFKTGFFFPEPQQTEPDYLNELHERYSPKLAAAIEAWKAVSADPTLTANKTVKQALVIWLRQHANRFGLTKEDGNPNEQGIEEVAKIANWDAKGGPPKRSAETHPPIQAIAKMDFPLLKD